MDNPIYAILLAILIICGVFGSVFLGIKSGIEYEKEHPCIKSHIEKQYDPPTYMVPQGTNIAMPMGNGKWVDVKVCDQRK